jgi:CheY-like chemotaxis protein
VKTVLIVEDEPGITGVLTELLEDEGYRVVTAANGEEGLLRLADTKPDVVVLDFMMPLLDGPGMARKMRSDPAYANIPIIMMSAVGEYPVRERFAGYVAFLAKPFRMPALIEAVTRAIAGRGPED